MHTSRTFSAALLVSAALPLALEAQQVAPAAARVAPATPASMSVPFKPGPVIQSFIGFHNNYGGWLKAAFDSMPASMYGYKPTAVQLSVGYIAQHLENANYIICAYFSGQTYTMTAKDSLADTVKAQWPKDTLVARLKASFAYCDDALTRVPDTGLADSIAIKGVTPPRSVPRSRFLILYIADLADHYSQIANYMRLNNMVPPSALPRPSR